MWRHRDFTQLERHRLDRFIGKIPLPTRLLTELKRALEFD